ncbi:hypothetical protein WDU94_015576, partial [Cyamophila willieti]
FNSSQYNCNLNEETVLSPLAETNVDLEESTESFASSDWNDTSVPTYLSYYEYTHSIEYCSLKQSTSNESAVPVAASSTTTPIDDREKEPDIQNNSYESRKENKDMCDLVENKESSTSLDNEALSTFFSNFKACKEQVSEQNNKCVQSELACSSNQNKRNTFNKKQATYSPKTHATIIHLAKSSMLDKNRNDNTHSSQNVSSLKKNIIRKHKNSGSFSSDQDTNDVHHKASSSKEPVLSDLDKNLSVTDNFPSLFLCDDNDKNAQTDEFINSAVLLGTDEKLFEESSSSEVSCNENLNQLIASLSDDTNSCDTNKKKKSDRINQSVGCKEEYDSKTMLTLESKTENKSLPSSWEQRQKKTETTFNGDNNSNSLHLNIELGIEMMSNTEFKIVKSSVRSKSSMENDYTNKKNIKTELEMESTETMFQPGENVCEPHIHHHQQHHHHHHLTKNQNLQSVQTQHDYNNQQQLQHHNHHQEQQHNNVQHQRQQEYQQFRQQYHHHHHQQQHSVQQNQPSHLQQSTHDAQDRSKQTHQQTIQNNQHQSVQHNHQQSIQKNQQQNQRQSIQQNQQPNQQQSIQQNQQQSVQQNQQQSVQHNQQQLIHHSQQQSNQQNQQQSIQQNQQQSILHNQQRSLQQNQHYQQRNQHVQNEVRSPSETVPWIIHNYDQSSANWKRDENTNREPCYSISHCSDSSDNITMHNKSELLSNEQSNQVQNIDETNSNNSTIPGCSNVVIPSKQPVANRTNTVTDPATNLYTYHQQPPTNTNYVHQKSHQQIYNTALDPVVSPTKNTSYNPKRFVYSTNQTVNTNSQIFVKPGQSALTKTNNLRNLRLNKERSLLRKVHQKKLMEKQISESLQDSNSGYMKNFGANSIQSKTQGYRQVPAQVRHMSPDARENTATSIESPRKPEEQPMRIQSIIMKTSNQNVSIMRKLDKSEEVTYPAMSNTNTSEETIGPFITDHTFNTAYSRIYGTSSETVTPYETCDTMVIESNVSSVQGFQNVNVLTPAQTSVQSYQTSVNSVIIQQDFNSVIIQQDPSQSTLFHYYEPYTNVGKTISYENKKRNGVLDIPIPPANRMMSIAEVLANPDCNPELQFKLKTISSSKVGK